VTEDPVAAYAAYMDAGYPVILNAPRGASPEIDRTCTDLGRALQAHVWPNVYATGTAGAPLNIHFDLHDVLVVQCEGEKEWRISSLRADRPLDVPEMRGTFEDAVEAMREQALASTAMTFTVKPGDAVYIPRGQFHMATTPSGRSLHVTFAIRSLCGYDLAQALCRLALADPRLRDYLPDLDQGAVNEQTQARLAEFKDRLKELLDGPNLAQALAAVRADLMAQSNGHRES
jgi:ribosomal protein L16 Arg81 hydroxylase